MATILKETLKTIERYKNMNPHYVELLDILEEILILREETRRRMKDDIFNVDEALVRAKLDGGLPLIDFTKNNFDLSEPRKYFISLLKVAEKRTPEETKEISRSDHTFWNLNTPEDFERAEQMAKILGME